MENYLMDIASVRRESKRVLGEFRGMSYDNATSQVQENEKLVITLMFKPGVHPHGLTEYVYSPTREDWPAFQADIDTFCKEEPKVHVVDAKWAIPI